MKNKILFGLLVLLPFFCLHIHAQTQTAPSKRSDIIRLLQMTGAAQGAKQALDLMLPSLKEAMPEVPDQVWQDCRAEVRDQEMIELTYQIWNKHFTHQEIRDLIRFYETPTGQKIIRETPALQQETLIAGKQWGDQIVGRVLARVKEKGYVVPANLQH
jgi:hypothetical protein